MDSVKSRQLFNTVRQLKFASLGELPWQYFGTTFLLAVQSDMMKWP